MTQEVTAIQARGLRFVTIWLSCGHCYRVPPGTVAIGDEVSCLQCRRATEAHKAAQAMKGRRQ